MKKIQLITAILFFSSIAFTQNFAPVNTTWHYKTFTWDFSLDSYIKIVSDRDTIIDGKYVTILEQFRNGEYIEEARMYIQESDNVVYFYENQEFRIWCNFNLEVGDTLESSIPLNGEYYNVSTNWPSTSVNETTNLVVDSISYLVIENQSLKTLHTRTLADPDSTNCIRYGSISERIGSRAGLFGSACTQTLAGSPGYLRCYSDDLIYYNPNAVDCESGISDTKEVEKDFIQIYPNPSSEFISIYSNKAELISSFELVNLNGKVVAKEKLTGSEIAVGFLPNGPYWLRIFDEDNLQIGTGKLIKH